MVLCEASHSHWCLDLSPLPILWHGHQALCPTRPLSRARLHPAPWNSSSTLWAYELASPMSLMSLRALNDWLFLLSVSTTHLYPEKPFLVGLSESKAVPAPHFHSYALFCNLQALWTVCVSVCLIIFHCPLHEGKATHKGKGLYYFCFRPQVLALWPACRKYLACIAK